MRKTVILRIVKACGGRDKGIIRDGRELSLQQEQLRNEPGWGSGRKDSGRGN